MQGKREFAANALTVPPPVAVAHRAKQMQDNPAEEEVAEYVHITSMCDMRVRSGSSMPLSAQTNRAAAAPRSCGLLKKGIAAD